MRLIAVTFFSILPLSVHYSLYSFISRIFAEYLKKKKCEKSREMNSNPAPAEGQKDFFKYSGHHDSFLTSLINKTDECSTVVLNVEWRMDLRVGWGTELPEYKE